MEYRGDTMLTTDIPDGEHLKVTGGRLVISRCQVGSNVTIENVSGPGYSSINRGNINIAPGSFNNAHNIAVGHGARVTVGGRSEQSSELGVVFDSVKTGRNLNVTSTATIRFNNGRIGQCSTLLTMERIEVGQDVVIEPGVILNAARVSIAGREIPPSKITENNNAAIAFRQARQILEEHGVSEPNQGEKVKMNLDDIGTEKAEQVFQAAQTLGLQPERVQDGHLTLSLGADQLLNLRRSAGGQGR